MMIILEYAIYDRKGNLVSDKSKFKHEDFDLDLIFLLTQLTGNSLVLLEFATINCCKIRVPNYGVIQSIKSAIEERPSYILLGHRIVFSGVFETQNVDIKEPETV